MGHPLTTAETTRDDRDRNEPAGQSRGLSAKETARLDALRRSGLLDTPPEKIFDDLVRVASVLLGMPMAAIHLVAKDRQWAKAEIGLGLREIPRAITFCTHAIEHDDFMEVRDAAADARFASNPFVLGEPGIRFYAAAPLTVDGHQIGTICVIDTKAHLEGLTATQRFALTTLADQVTSQIALRRALRHRDDLLEAQSRSDAFRRNVLDSAIDYAVISIDLDGCVTGWSAGAHNVLGWSEEEMVGQPAALFFTPEDVASGRPALEMRSALESGRGTDERWHMRKDGTRFWANGEMTVLHTDDAVAIGFVKVMRDRTEQHLAGERAEREASQFEALIRAQQAAESGSDGALDLWRCVATAALNVVPDADSSSIEEVEDDDLVYRVAEGGLQAGQRIPRSGTLSGLCLDQGRLLVSDDALVDVRTDPVLVRHLGIRSVIVVPIPRRGEFVGVLKLASKRPGAFTRRDAALAQLLVGILATGLSSLAEQRAQQALRNSESRFRLMADAVPQMVWQADADGHVDTVNRRWSEFTGLPESVATTDGGWIAPIHPEDRGPARAAWLAAQRGGTEFRTNYRYRSAEGAYRWLLVIGIPYRDPQSGQISRWFGGAIDVDAEYRAQEVTRRENEELGRTVADRTRERDQIWQVTTDMLCVATLEGMFTSLNPAWSEALGWTVAEMTASPFVDFVHPDDRDGTLEALAGLKRGESKLGFENRYRHKGGNYRWLSWNAVARDGFVYAAVRDLTEEKKRTLALRQAEEQLHQSQKMDAVGQLTGGVAHDFNNLLTVIRSSTDLLRRPDLSDERRRRYLDAMSDTVDRAAKLTGQLLAFARRQALQPEVFDAAERISAVADLLDKVTGARIRVEVSMPDGRCHVRADASQFDTALVNMAVNARDAMDGEGVLSLQLTRDVALPQIRGHAGSPGPFVSVSMTDTGAGIGPGTIGRIFEPFFTTKEVGKGTGLGLSQVFGFVKQSGGDIDVRSDVDVGTTFTLYLPQVDSAPSSDHRTRHQQAPSDGIGLRVLVVEDNVEIGRFATQILEDFGYQPVWAANAGEALEHLAGPEHGFDVVFSDVVMPGISGIDLAQQIRSRFPDLPIVLASGYSHVLAAEGPQGFELLHKPYSAEQLSAVLRRAAAR